MRNECIFITNSSLGIRGQVNCSRVLGDEDGKDHVELLQKVMDDIEMFYQGEE